jgi:YfiH family protein
MQIVRSNIFESIPGILFGMSTFDGGVSSGKFGLNLSFNVNDLQENVIKNRNRFFTSLGIVESQVAFTEQKHTTNIAVVDLPGSNENCDAIYTDRKNIFIAISIADCTPVMLYDNGSKAIAGIHAGWRGTAGRIVEKTIREMKRRHNTKAENIIAFIGPSAGKCCYEVNDDVAKQFPKECSDKKENGKYLLDVKHANMIQLLEIGVLNSNIEMHPDCTIHNTKYHSFRRDGNQSGRMFAIIGMKE